MLYIVPLDAGRSGEIDEPDLQLIRLLQVNGRAPFAQLAQQTGLPERQVARKVALLIEAGVIQIAPVCNPAALGLHALALVAIRLDGKVDGEAFALSLLDKDCIDYAALTLGAYDLLVEVMSPDDRSLRLFIQDEIRSRPEVAAVEVWPCIGLAYQQPAWDAAEAKDQTPEATVGLYQLDSKELDPIDRHLVALLGRDGRATFQALAPELGVSESYVRKRYSALATRADFGVHALTNPQSVGFRTTCWLQLKVLPGWSGEEVARGLKALDRVAYVALCTGPAGLLVEVVCRNKDDLRAWFNDKLTRIEGLEMISSLLCTDIYYRRVHYGSGE